MTEPPKAFKKAKTFFDDKQKPKQRLQALYGFLESASSSDQERFFLDFHDQAFAVVMDGFNRLISKIKSKDKSDRSYTLSSKEIVELLKVVNVLRKLFVCVTDLIHDGAHAEPIATMLRYLLTHNNHPRLRQEGFRLLSAWLVVLVEAPNSKLAQDLFKDAILLGSFESFVPPKQWQHFPSLERRSKSQPVLEGLNAKHSGQKPIEVPDLHYLVPHPSLPTPAEMLGLVSEFLSVLTTVAHCEAVSPAPAPIQVLTRCFPWDETDPGVLSDHSTFDAFGRSGLGDAKIRGDFADCMPATFRTTAWLWELLKKWYLKILFPDVCAKLGTQIEAGSGYSTCPPPILGVLVRFFTETCQHSVLCPPQTALAHSPASFALQTILFGSQENLELIHQAIQQSFLLPYSCEAISLGALKLIRGWTTATPELRPPFLSRTLSSLDEAVSPTGQELAMHDPLNSPRQSANAHLRSYIAAARLVWLERAEDGDVSVAQFSLCKESLDFYRDLANQKELVLESDTWEAMMAHLLSIHTDAVCVQDKSAVFPNPNVASEMTSIIVETLIFVWIRSGTRTQKHWVDLQVQISRGTHWLETIQLWEKTIVKLTKLLGPLVYGVNLDAADAEPHSRRRYISLSQNGFFAQSRPLTRINTVTKETSAAPPMSEVNETTIATLEGRVMDKTQDPFTDLNGMGWGPEWTLGIWKNVLCLLGNPVDIKAGENHLACVEGLRNVWELLLTIRLAQPYASTSTPPLFEFAPWLFQATDMGKGYEPSAVCAYGAISKLMCRRHDEPFHSDYYANFYRLLIKGLLSQKDSVFSAIVNNCTSLFTLCLPGAQILAPTFIQVISSMFTFNSTRNLSDVVCKNAATILSSLLVLPNLYGAVSLPVFELNPLSEVAQVASQIAFLELKSQLLYSIIQLLPDDRHGENAKRLETHSILLYTLTTLCFEEMLVKTKPDLNLIEDCIHTLLSHLYLSSGPVVCTTIDCLIFLAQNVKMDDSTSRQIIEKIVQAIHEHLQENIHTGKEANTTARLYGCLQEWVLVLSPELMQDSKLTRLVFGSLEAALAPSPSTNSSAADFIHLQRISSVTDTARIGNLKSRHASHDELFAKETAGGVGAGTSATLPGLGNAALVNRIQGYSSERKGSYLPSHAARDEAGKKDDDLRAVEDMAVDETIMEAAENALWHFLQYIQLFPTPYGATSLGSTIVEPLLGDEPGKESDRCLFFTFNDNSLVTVLEIPGSSPTDSRTRFIVRNMTGKYVWDSLLFYESLEKAVQASEMVHIPRSHSTSFEDSHDHDSAIDFLGVADDLDFNLCSPGDEPVPTSIPVAEYQREAQELPLWKSHNAMENADLLNELLSYIQVVHPDCLLADGFPLNQPSERSPGNAIAPLLQSFTAAEVAAGELFKLTPISDDAKVMIASGSLRGPEMSHLSLVDSSALETPTGSTPPPSRLNPLKVVEPPEGEVHQDVKAPPAPRSQYSSATALDSLLHNFMFAKPPKVSSSSFALQKSRLLLSHLGFLSFDGTKGGGFHMLTKSAALYRDIKGLDKRYSRDTMKIALIYVAPGQEDESAVFHNESGSPDYEQFVQSLGWEVELASHTGYLGGLDRNGGTTGSQAVYYCDSGLEIMYHDVTRMPNDLSDPKQVRKKRHIGNDHVHIIWNEHLRDYRKEVIKGDFGNAVIVVNPMSNGLFAIDIFRDKKVGSRPTQRHPLR